MKKILVFSFIASLALIFACGSDESNPAPAVKAGFSFIPANPKVGEAVIFINESEDATTFAWDFGDGTSSTERNPQKTYSAEKTYKVKLTATGATSVSVEKDIVVGVDANALITLTGNLTTQTLDATRKYLLKGNVVIPDGVTLTVPAGTVIFGEKASKAALIVSRGGKLIANGTATSPVVFTSNQEPGARDKGDWAGIIMLGKATVNQANPSIEGLTGFNYGGTDDADNSGSLKYVRIEYAGIEFTPNNETNSLTMGGVGSGTTLEYIQLSFGGDDGFEWFGGTVNAKWLISFGMWDDDFDCDFGFRGKVQFGLVVRYPSYADQSGSVFFEVDNDGSGTAATPITAPTFSNITLIGPRQLNAFGSRRASSINANFTQALHFRRNSEIALFNSIITGYPNGFRLDDASTFDAYESNVLVGTNYLVMPGGTNFVTNVTTGKTSTDVQNIWNRPTGAEANFLINAGSSRDVAPILDSLGLASSLFWGNRLDNAYNDNAEPDFKVGANKPILMGASYTNSRLADAHFNKTGTFIGAFGSSTDWTDGWSNFDPKDKQY